MAQILTRDNYGMTFNTPRQPQRHTIERVRFFPLRRIVRPLEALAVPMVVPMRFNYDLLHTFNQIPVTHRPWLTSFESIIPRAFGWGHRQVTAMLRKRLALPNCTAVIAISEYARKRFLVEHAAWEGLEQVLEKTHVIHPNLPLVRTEPKRLSGEELHLIFIGRDWARKGGVVALRVAREAQKRGLPIRLTMVSSMDNANYAQHPDPRRYAADRALLSLPNVVHHKSLPNAEALRLMAEADFGLLPTTHDTYGFSVLESMASGTPAIVTNAAALAEVVQDGVNGYALKVAQNDLGEYARINETDWAIWDAFYDDLAKQTLVRLEALLESPSEYEQLSAQAIHRIQNHHEAGKLGAQIETLYDAALYGVI